MKFFLTILLTLLSINAYAQSSNIVAPITSSDCQSVYLTDVAGTKLGPYSREQATQKLNTAIISRKNLVEQVAYEDVQIEVSTIALSALNSCIVPPILTTNVNLDEVALLASQGVNWPDIKSAQSNINWPEVNAMNGINWDTINKSNINWENWPVAETQGVNWYTFVTTD